MSGFKARACHHVPFWNVLCFVIYASMSQMMEQTPTSTVEYLHVNETSRARLGLCMHSTLVGPLHITKPNFAPFMRPSVPLLRELCTTSTSFEALCLKLSCGHWFIVALPLD